MATGFEPCGCCAGADIETPARIDNPPGQRSVAYRAGVHASFKESLQARLSSAELPALARLGTREDSDFTIALCDALATTLDVLGFYQERIANESFLRTATERRSVLELASLIGYEMDPGVAASTHLAFTLQEAPGIPALAAEPVTIPVGTRVQSVPGPGEQAQSFETVEAVAARVEWNAIPVQTDVAWHPRSGDTELHLAGVGHSLQAGDVILIVGQERVEDPTSKRWHVRLLTEVEVDVVRRHTRLRWSLPLGGAGQETEPAASGVVVCAFRQRAALFGHNAPDPRLMDQSRVAGLVAESGDWNFGLPSGRIDLDAPYSKITPGSWLALVSSDTPTAQLGPSNTELCSVRSVSFPSRADFGLSGKVTRIQPDTSISPDKFITRTDLVRADLVALGTDPRATTFTKPISRRDTRTTLVLAQSEILPVATTPLAFPLHGEEIALGRAVEGIASGRALAVSGKRARVRLRKGASPATLELESAEPVTLEAGDSLRLAAAPEQQAGNEWEVLSPQSFGACLRNPAGRELRLTLLDRNDARGTCRIPAAAIELVPAEEADGEIGEIATVAELVNPTTLALTLPLEHCYDRVSAHVNANVAFATHGETVTEILGSGDLRQPNARFVLRQGPLTYVSAPTPSGSRSTLELRANDLLWKEVPSLFGSEPSGRVYDLVIDDEARTTVRFGDGVEGARLPSGDHNVRARYRKGLGLAGNVGAGKLTTLLSRPLGVTGARNPEPATGGEDPETSSQARVNAPLDVLTLDRAVSIRDYRDFARSFSGVAKAHALWIPSGPARGVFLSVAGEQGAPLPEGNKTLSDLQAALFRHGSPLTPLRLATYRDARFQLRVGVKVAADAEPPRVLAAVESRLREVFGFAAREFGQGVSADEVSAVVQAVAGVVAVHVAELHRSTRPVPARVPRLFAELPFASPTVLPRAAELLRLDDAPIALDVMS